MGNDRPDALDGTQPDEKDVAGFLDEKSGGEAASNEALIDEGAGADPRSLANIDWVGTGDATGLKGMEAIQEIVTHLPNSPGVYRMLNEAGDVLYVGKAKSLKKRVSQYAQGRSHSSRIPRMVQETRTMQFVTTRTEIEALLLEANLIKRLRPRFNVLLRDDKSFPYIILTRNHRAPGLFKHRGARSHKGDYFGPFASAGAVDRTINALQRAFLVRTCTDSVFESRTRPCLLFQIKRCSGPCTREVSDSDYEELVREAKDFLSGKSQKVKAQISTMMQEASDALDFERAAALRDRLSSLSHVQSHQGINSARVEEADIFAIHQEGGQTCIEVFFFRTGQNWGNASYFPKADPSIESKEVLGAFLAQFYEDKPCPPLILLSEEIEERELLEEALSSLADRRISVAIPQRGEKKQLVLDAHRNARESLGRRLAETSSQARLLNLVAEVFKLTRVPRRIEVYDNSHIMGTNAVGAMIVAGPEGFVKNQYRKFNIRAEDFTAGDDFGMMREVMTRRFLRLIKENGIPEAAPLVAEPAPDADVVDDVQDDNFPAWPDLLLIDGGEGQLKAALKILEELGIQDAVMAIGVAKGVDRDAGRERFFLPDGKNFTLPVRDPVLYFLQRMRDEAHRFAIGAHRARRKKDFVRNPLDEIPGIGPTRKRTLLHHFGTAKAVSKAAIEDLRVVEGISDSIARLIYDHFHDKG